MDGPGRRHEDQSPSKGGRASGTSVAELRLTGAGQLRARIDRGSAVDAPGADGVERGENCDSHGAAHENRRNYTEDPIPAASRRRNGRTLVPAVIDPHNLSVGR